MQATFSMISICYTQEKQDKVLISKILTEAVAAAYLSGALAACHGCSLAASWPLVSDFETEDWLNFQKVHLRNCFPPFNLIIQTQPCYQTLLQLIYHLIRLYCDSSFPSATFASRIE